ncbi:response regulator [Maridesulfovibrio sp.]|uniref:response regulator n=1 Tax=Maridesulfovibrio sp. TaxID=2795000 RepID=UPI002A186DD4|nr:response regulator [Maridesulfovibrio sp.]
MSKNIRFVLLCGCASVLLFSTGLFLSGLNWVMKLSLFASWLVVMATAVYKLKKYYVEEQLKQIQQTAAILRHSGICFYTADEQGDLVFCDDSCRDLARDIFGRAGGAELSRILQHFHSEKGLESISGEIFSGNGAYRFEMDLTAADGKLVRLCHVLQHTYCPEGNISGFAGTVRNISEQERYRDESARLQRYLKAALDCAPGTMFLHDLEGTFITVGQKFAEFAGIAPEMCIGTSIYDYLAPQIADQLLARVQDIAAGGSEFAIQIPAINSRGERLHLDIRHFLIRNDNGEPEAIVGCARRIDNRNMDIKTVKGEGDEILMQAICHEMRTPLAGIIGSLHVLDQMNLAPEAKEYVHKCVVSAERFKDVVNNSLSDLSGKHDPRKFESLDPAAILEKSVDLFLPAASIQNRKINLSIGLDLPDAIICNRKVLGQMLFCLINSGLDIFPDSDITAGIKLVPSVDNYSVLTFYVSGDGCVPVLSGGSYSDCLEQNAKVLDGELYFEDGSTAELGFRIKVPAGKKAAEQELVPIQSLRIILAEDDISSQVFMRKKLESWGHSVRTASTGVEVLNHIENEEFDLILMDLQMPEMNGFDAISFIRNGKPQVRELSIIVMSAYGRESDFKKMSDLGVNDYIAKPVSTEELEKALARLLELGSFSSRRT